MILIVQRDHVTVRIGPGLASFEVAGREVATARFSRRQWTLRIPGHQWEVTPDMPTARFNAIPGGKITRTPVKGFRSWQACAEEIKRLGL